MRMEITVNVVLFSSSESLFKVTVTIGGCSCSLSGHSWIFRCWESESVTNELNLISFFLIFTSRSRSWGISISLSLLEKSETKNHFTFHFSKRVKGLFLSLFISKKKWKHFWFHSVSRERKKWNYAPNTNMQHLEWLPRGYPKTVMTTAVDPNAGNNFHSIAIGVFGRSRSVPRP